MVDSFLQGRIHTVQGYPLGDSVLVTVTFLTGSRMSEIMRNFSRSIEKILLRC